MLKKGAATKEKSDGRGKSSKERVREVRGPNEARNSLPGNSGIIKEVIRRSKKTKATRGKNQERGNGRGHQKKKMLEGTPPLETRSRP